MTWPDVAARALELAPLALMLGFLAFIAWWFNRVTSKEDETP